jgi:Fe2+ or Zn2+ uptake regulation protein
MQTIRRSAKRNQILTVLQKEKGPLSAADIHGRLPEIDLATIYRNLERFTNERWIRKIRLSAKQAEYEHQEEKHHHAICKTGDTTLHFTVPEKRIIKLLGLKDFRIEDVDIVVTGSCKHCYEITGNS